jgi:hypothetical protein
MPPRSRAPGAETGDDAATWARFRAAQTAKLAASARRRAWRRRQTQRVLDHGTCPAGHRLQGSNTFVNRATGQRECRACNRDARRAA